MAANGRWVVANGDLSKAGFGALGSVNLFRQKLKVDQTLRSTHLESPSDEEPKVTFQVWRHLVFGLGEAARECSGGLMRWVERWLGGVMF